MRKTFLLSPHAFIHNSQDGRLRHSNGAVVLVSRPVFNTINIHVWFLQLSAIFQVKKIQSQTAHFVYVVEKLPPDVASVVSDLLDNVPTEKPFDVQKEAIVYRTGKSEEQRINDLFKDTST